MWLKTYSADDRVSERERDMMGFMVPPSQVKPHLYFLIIGSAFSLLLALFLSSLFLPSLAHPLALIYSAIFCMLTWLIYVRIAFSDYIAHYRSNGWLGTTVWHYSGITVGIKHWLVLVIFFFTLLSFNGGWQTKCNVNLCLKGPVRWTEWGKTEEGRREYVCQTVC